MRTAKSCGPGAPKARRQVGDDASHHADDGGNRQGSPGRSRISRKPLRREGRLSPPVPVVNALFAQFFARAPRVHAATRSSLRPPIAGGSTTKQSSGETRREDVKACLSAVVPAKAGTHDPRPE